MKKPIKSGWEALEKILKSDDFSPETVLAVKEDFQTRSVMKYLEAALKKFAEIGDNVEINLIKKQNDHGMNYLEIIITYPDFLT